MLLEELGLATIKPHRTRKVSFDKYKELSNPYRERVVQPSSPFDKTEFLGSGRYGNAHAQVDEPGTITKVVYPKESLDKDAYFKYLSYLVKHGQGSDNRFFPKIYDVKLYRTKDKKLVYAVKMERLHEFLELELDELKAIGNQLFFNFEELVRNDRRQGIKYSSRFDSSFKRPHGKNLATPESEKIDAYQVAFNMLIGDAIWSKGTPTTYIKDPEFKRALMIIKSISKTHEMTPDVTPQNIMIRRGAFTPQLVLTDPVT